MTGPGHKLRALVALGLLPLLLAAEEGPCLLCTAPDNKTPETAEQDIPLSIDITTKLDFSCAALSGQGGGHIEVDPSNGTRRVNGGILDLGGSVLAGAAVVRGQPGRSVRIDMPTTARMTSSQGGVVEIAGLRTSLIGNSRLDQQGRLDFSFGGTLIVRGNATGTFRARIPITVQYE